MLFAATLATIIYSCGATSDGHQRLTETVARKLLKFTKDVLSCDTICGAT
jgi:hypothetical protein